MLKVCLDDLIYWFDLIIFAVDVHFPNLTVGDTLTFAAQARTPHTRIPGITREQYAAHMRDVIMAVFGITHTFNSK